MKDIERGNVNRVEGRGVVGEIERGLRASKSEESIK